MVRFSDVDILCCRHAWLPYALVFSILCPVWKWKGKIVLYCERLFVINLAYLTAGSWMFRFEHVEALWFLHGWLWCVLVQKITCFSMNSLRPDLSIHNTINFTIKGFDILEAVFIPLKFMHQTKTKKIIRIILQYSMYRAICKWNLNPSSCV